MSKEEEEEERGKRKEERGKRKEERGKRKEERGKRKVKREKRKEKEKKNLLAGVLVQRNKLLADILDGRVIVAPTCQRYKFEKTTNKQTKNNSKWKKKTKTNHHSQGNRH